MRKRNYLYEIPELVFVVAVGLGGLFLAWFLIWALLSGIPIMWRTVSG